MGTLAVGSVRSCGVTTMVAALAAGWPEDRRRLVIELDHAGGTLAALFGLRSEPGLVSLAAAARRRSDPELLWEHSQELADGTAVLAGPPSAEQARTALGLLGPLLAQLDELGSDVLIDCGRLDATSIAREAFEDADVALLLARPQLPDMHCLASWLERRTGSARQITVVLVGAGPYKQAEVADALHVEVLGEVPFDPDGVAALTSGAPPRVRARSPLLRHARSLADAIVKKLSASEPASRPVRSERDERAPTTVPIHVRAAAQEASRT